MNSAAIIPDYRDNNAGNLVPGMTSSRGELLAHELISLLRRVSYADILR